jgi:hypothetical protein
MKKCLLAGLVLFGVHFLFGFGASSLFAQESSTSVINLVSDNNNDNSKVTIIYCSYNGSATDDGNITGKNTSEEFHLFMKNGTQNIVYVISKSNYELWSSKKIMPAELMPMMKTYRVDIAESKKLEDGDDTVEFYEITKLNSMVESDEIDE